jgi:serine/threonine-protein kinase HipA
MADVLNVSLGNRRVGAITGLGAERSIFVFADDYADDPRRPTLSLSFKAETGGLLRDQRSTQARLLPYFSNLLPEGELRHYLAARAGVKPSREFFLLWALGIDLPGAVVATAEDGQPFPPGKPLSDKEQLADHWRGRALRFSLAGVQLKFSALERAAHGLTIPARGSDGDWIVKLPSTRYAGLAENEFSMMSLARAIGIDVPEIRLLRLNEIDNLPEGLGRLEGSVYAIRRFDRSLTRGRLHTEDFAQVFAVYPEDKYQRASYRNIAQVIWREAGEAGLVEFIRRLVFNALIGNADMHLKNWSLLYQDGIRPSLSPAYDFVSTVTYIPDDGAALKVVRSKFWRDFDQAELAMLARKAGLPEHLVLVTAEQTVALFREVWARERAHFPLAQDVVAAIENQLALVPLAGV